jgi:hypothetical protein
LCTWQAHYTGTDFRNVLAAMWLKALSLQEMMKADVVDMGAP